MPADAFIDLPQPRRVVAVGDIHGDLDALLRILVGTGLIGEDAGDWIGGTACLVLMGDLNDSGNDSIAVMDLLMGLQSQAPQSGGAVHALLGNHEALVADGNFRYVSAVEALSVEGWWFDNVNGLHAVYRGSSPYAEWIRSRPVMMRVGGSLFVHAGLDRWALDHDLVFLARATREWIAHVQGVAPEPDPSTFWLVSDAAPGPLWTDRLRVSDGPIDGTEGLGEVLAQALERAGARRLIVGHKPTAALDFQIAFPHPAFGDRVALIDTGICKRYGGRLSALEIAGGDITALYFERGSTELPLTKSIRAIADRNRLRMAEESAS